NQNIHTPTIPAPTFVQPTVIPDNNATNFESSQGSGMSPQVAKEIQKLKDMISSVPGVIRPIPEVSQTAHGPSRFAPPICDVEIPKKFQIPNMKLYATVPAAGADNLKVLSHDAGFKSRDDFHLLLRISPGAVVMALSPDAYRPCRPRYAGIIASTQNI
ncbi:MAG: hypothetical protein Q8874_02600, partial [Sweet potato little leaf phytoplasma]|nr:hypothetical protein [Sweet potato little leaf phytoplasma]